MAHPLFWNSFIPLSWSLPFHKWCIIQALTHSGTTHKFHLPRALKTYNHGQHVLRIPTLITSAHALGFPSLLIACTFLSLHQLFKDFALTFHLWRNRSVHSSLILPIYYLLSHFHCYWPVLRPDPVLTVLTCIILFAVGHCSWLLNSDLRLYFIRNELHLHQSLSSEHNIEQQSEENQGAMNMILQKQIFLGG